MRSGGRRRMGSRRHREQRRRSAERRVGEEGRTRGGPYDLKKKKNVVLAEHAPMAGDTVTGIASLYPSAAGTSLCLMPDRAAGRMVGRGARATRRLARPGSVGA